MVGEKEWIKKSGDEARSVRRVKARECGKEGAT